MAEILKVQRPLNPPDAAWLIYNRDRSITSLIPRSEVPDNIVKMMGNDPKMYVFGELIGGDVYLGNKAKEQSW